MLLSLLTTFFPYNVDGALDILPLLLPSFQLRLVWQEVQPPDVFSSFRKKTSGHEKNTQ